MERSSEGITNLNALNGHLVKEKLRDGYLIAFVDSRDKQMFMVTLGGSVTKPLGTVIIDPGFQMGNQWPKKAERMHLDYCLLSILVSTTE